MDAFVRPPVQQAQSMDDTEPSTPLYIKNPEAFAVFFEHVVTQCRALGNPELEQGRDLLVISIDHATWSGGADPRHARVLFAFLVAFARIFMRPLFVHKDMVPVLMSASDGHPFALVAEERPSLESLAHEDYVVWIPQRRVVHREEESNESEPLIVDVSDDDDGPPQKRARLTYTCANCCTKNARFLAPLLPMCSRQCVRDFYMFS
jgi:hypothetical protein